MTSRAITIGTYLAESCDYLSGPQPVSDTRWGEVFSERGPNFKLCPIVSYYVQHIIPRKRKIFPWSSAALITDLLPMLRATTSLPSQLFAFLFHSAVFPKKRQGKCRLHLLLWPLFSLLGCLAFLFSVYQRLFISLLLSSTILRKTVWKLINTFQ